MDEPVSFGEMARLRDERDESVKGPGAAGRGSSEGKGGKLRAGVTVFREFATQVDRKIRDE